MDGNPYSSNSMFDWMTYRCPTVKGSDKYEYIVIERSCNFSISYEHMNTGVMKDCQLERIDFSVFPKKRFPLKEKEKENGSLFKLMPSDKFATLSFTKHFKDMNGRKFFK